MNIDQADHVIVQIDSSNHLEVTEHLSRTTKERVAMISLLKNMYVTGTLF